MDDIYLSPCCIHKHLGEYLERNQPTSFFSNSDWNLSRFLELLCLYVPGSELTVCIPKISDELCIKLQSLLGQPGLIGKMNAIFNEPGPSLQLVGNEVSVSISQYPIGFRMLAISNGERHVVVTGSFNQQQMHVGMQLQHFILCTGIQVYEDTMCALRPIIKMHRLK